jgi:hypothetical protein
MIDYMNCAVKFELLKIHTHTRWVRNKSIAIKHPLPYKRVTEHTAEFTCHMLGLGEKLVETKKPVLMMPGDTVTYNNLKCKVSYYEGIDGKNTIG